MFQTIAAGIGGLLVGASLGFLGAGGTVVTLPLLLALGVAPGPAIASSLAVVAAVSAVAAVAHARAGRVDWWAVALFAPATALGGYAGGRAAAWIDVELLLLGFEALMLAAGLAMLRARPLPTSERPRRGRLLFLGAGIGALAGLVGAGGGFLFVPALTLLGGLSMPLAVGSSLLVICANSVAALLGHMEHVALNLEITGPVAATAALGALLGARFASRTPDTHLRRAFGVFVLVVAAAMLIRSLLRAAS